MLQRGPQPEFWRAFVDNERETYNISYNADSWRRAAKDLVVESVDLEPGGKVTFNMRMKDIVYKVRYTMFSSGEIEVDATYDLPQIVEDQSKREKKNGALGKWLYPLRVGMEWMVSPELDHVEWYGRGPTETQADRKFEPVGRFASTVDEEWVEYNRPQENGNKTDVRWFAMKDGNGNGLLFSAIEDNLGVGARFYSRETMEESDYSFQMKRDSGIHVNIDHMQAGVGGINSWGRPPLPAYLLKESQYHYRYRVQPLNGNVEASLKQRVKP